MNTTDNKPTSGLGKSAKQNLSNRERIAHRIDALRADTHGGIGRQGRMAAFRRRVCVWFVIFVALAGQPDRNRFEFSISMSLKWRAAQQIEMPREVRLQKRRSTTADRDRERNRGRARP